MNPPFCTTKVLISTGATITCFFNFTVCRKETSCMQMRKKKGSDQPRRLIIDAVVSVANYRPRGPWFETWPLGRRSFTWHWTSHISPLLQYWLNSGSLGLTTDLDRLWRGWGGSINLYTRSMFWVKIRRKKSFFSSEIYHFYINHRWLKWNFETNTMIRLRSFVVCISRKQFSRDAVHWVISLSDDTKVCH